MKKYLITGGSGFIGTNLVESLLIDNLELVNLDIAKPRFKKHLAYWKNVDILEYNALEKAICDFGPQVIIHLASVTHLNGRNLSDYDANIKGTQNIITVAAKLRTLEKIVFTSSMYVCRPGFIPTDFDTYYPHTVYGQSKVQGELLVKSIQRSQYDWVIIRPTSIWGPWFDTPYIDFFRIVHQERFFDFGKTCTKTYGYIDNTIIQIRKLAESKVVHTKTFYLGDSPPTQITEWANEISIELGKRPIRKVSYILVKSAAVIGDVLKSFNIGFPITSSRLNNMMTDNIFPLHELYEITGPQTFSRVEGVIKTVRWLKEYHK